MKSSVNIRKYKDSDAAGMSELRKKFPDAGLVHPCSKEYYEHKYSRGPMGTSEVWVAEDNDEIVAMIGTVLRRVKIGYQYLIAAELCDAFTHPAYQGQGIYSAITKQLLESLGHRGVDLIYGLPNEIAYPLWTRKFGFSHPFSLQRMCKIIHLDKYLDTILHRRFGGNALGHVGKWGAKAISGLLSKTPPTFANELEVYRMDFFDEETDGLWTRIERCYPIAIVRDHEYLNWRYSSNLGKYEIYGYRNDNGIVGIVVLKIQDMKSINCAYMVDIFTEREPTLALHIIANVINLLKSRGADIILTYCPAGGFHFNILRKMGFDWRGSTVSVLLKRFIPVGTVYFVFKDNSSDVCDVDIADQASWLFTMGDSDHA